MARRVSLKLHHLRPTQITVGLREVHDKITRFKAMRAKKLDEYLGDHPLPGIMGPHDKLFIIDHHHLGRALHELQVEEVHCLVEADLSTLTPEQFWAAMDANHWAHPYCEQGRRQSFLDIPKHVEQLRDDPYRSLAAYVREAGGYVKTPSPFAEFQWADYFRTRIAPTPVLVKHEGEESEYQALVAHAVALAKLPAAAALPGSQV